jgi:hypothetical protein
MTILLILLLAVILAASRGVKIPWGRMTAQGKTAILIVLFLVVIPSAAI